MNLKWKKIRSVMEDIELNTLNIKEKVLKNDLQAYRPQNKRCSTVEHV